MHKFIAATWSLMWNVFQCAEKRGRKKQRGEVQESSSGNYPSNGKFPPYTYHTKHLFFHVHPYYHIHMCHMFVPFNYYALAPIPTCSHIGHSWPILTTKNVIQAPNSSGCGLSLSSASRYKDTIQTAYPPEKCWARVSFISIYSGKQHELQQSQGW